VVAHDSARAIALRGANVLDVQMFAFDSSAAPLSGAQVVRIALRWFERAGG
jgi:hypothetical protein